MLSRNGDPHIGYHRALMNERRPVMEPGHHSVVDAEESHLRRSVAEVDMPETAAGRIVVGGSLEVVMDSLETGVGLIGHLQGADSHLEVLGTTFAVRYEGLLRVLTRSGHLHSLLVLECFIEYLVCAHLQTRIVEQNCRTVMVMLLRGEE